MFTSKLKIRSCIFFQRSEEDKVRIKRSISIQLIKELNEPIWNNLRENT